MNILREKILFLYNAGQGNQGPDTIAIGTNASNFNQDIFAISIGAGDLSFGGGPSSQINQGFGAISIGAGAGNQNQSTGAVAIGFLAGSLSQGFASIAIGGGGGDILQSDNSICLMANWDNFSTENPGLYVNPVREMVGNDSNYNNSVIFNTDTNEIAHIPNIINRVNPGSGTPLLLDNFNTIHYYNGTALSSFDISTQMVNDGVYEIKISCSGSSTPNNDFTILPNYGTYSGTVNFYTVYQNITGSPPGLGYLAGNNAGGFSVDMVGGSFGFDPVITFKIFNNQYAKKIQYQISDTTCAGTGSGYWLTSAFAANSGSAPSYDNTNVWHDIGRITFGRTFAHWNIWVKRIG